MKDFFEVEPNSDLININLGVASYNVQIGSKLISTLVAELLIDKNQSVVIIDEVVSDLIKNRCENFDELNLIEIKAKKESKTLATLTDIISKIELLNLPRSTKFIAIGGGIIGDIAGLIASLWYRGCELIHVPTTLLAAVDSCIGGKTAINLNTTINAIGTYYHPSKIIIDTDLLKNLPSRELKSGLAEVIKYSILGNTKISGLLKTHDYSELVKIEKLKEIIKLCLRQKEQFVRGDIKEKSKRLLLNLGHTIGHAFEINSIVDGTEQLRHGEGVALGITAISKIAVEVELLCPNEFQKIRSLIKKFGLPNTTSAELFSCDRSYLIEKCVNSTFNDKKRTTNSLRLILPTSSTGICKIYHTNSKKLIRSGIDFVLENKK